MPDIIVHVRCLSGREASPGLNMDVFEKHHSFNGCTRPRTFRLQNQVDLSFKLSGN